MQANKKSRSLLLEYILVEWIKVLRQQKHFHFEVGITSGEITVVLIGADEQIIGVRAKLYA